MLECGGFTDPRARLFWLRDRLEAAALALVDIGLHSGTLDLAAAEALLVGRVLMPRGAAAAAVRAAALDPAHALCAQVGSVMIGQLRDEWRSQLGARFEPAAFRTALLRAGRLPISLIREELLGHPPA